MATMQTQRLLVVGGSLGQLPAIERAVALGLEVIVVDRDEFAPGMSIAQIGHVVDVAVPAEVARVALAYEVSGALTMQSDVGVPAVGAVVDALALPGCGSRVARHCSNKILAREILEQAGVPQPRYQVIVDSSSAVATARQIGFPCVIKSPDSSGSRGVTKVSHEGEVGAAYQAARKFTNGELVLVEEFVGGVEVGAQTFSRAGRCELVLVHDDELSPPPFMVPVAHAFPSSLKSCLLPRVQEAVARAVEALEIRDGPANVDLIIDEDGVPQIIEIGARIGATCLPELVQYHTGIDWSGAAVEAAMGGRPSLEVVRKTPVAAFILESGADGVMAGHSLESFDANQVGILEWEVTARRGDKVFQLRTGTNRVGKVIAEGSSAQQAMDRARSFRDSFEVFLEEDEGGPSA